MGWCIYLLECKDESLYTGITNNLEKRMEAHKTGKGSKYVRAKYFKRLLYSKPVKSRSAALKTEYKLKQLERDDKIAYFVKHK